MLPPQREVARADADESEAVGVASRHGGPGPRERGEQIGMRVPVVVLADPDERDAGRDRGIESRGLVAASVMRDLDDVDGAELAGGGEKLLRVLAEVSEQERARQVGAGDLDDEAGVVARLEGAGAGARPQDPPVRVAEDARLAREALPHVARHGAGLVEVALLRDRAVDDGARTALERRNPRDVIGVEVREEGQVDLVDAETGETALKGRGVGAGIDDRRTAR